MNKEFKFTFAAKTKPFAHQIEAIDYVQKRDSIALFDEQGLGKTKIVIEGICNNIDDKLIDGALIICRKNLIQTWQDEIETHSYLKSIVLRGSVREKGMRFMGFAHFYLINYESVKGELERLKMFLKVRKLAIILDESHAIKNPESKATQAILQLAPLAKKRIIISGTPVANRPEDIWSQFYFLDQGALLGETYSEFKSRHTVDVNSTDSFLNKEILTDLRSLISNNSIRRKKNDVLELPDKVFYERFVHMTGMQKIMYEQLNNNLYLEVKNLDGDTIVDQSDDLLKKLLRLVQLASNPGLVDQSYNETPAKFKALDELILEIIAKGEKVIIWSCFVENIKLLNKQYAKFGALTIYGDIPIDVRNNNVKKFKSDSDRKILIANPAAAKEGLTLTIANNAIYLDRNFNLVDYLQSQDRIHRISQTKECNIYKLIAEESIDIYIDEILNRKHYIANYVQGGNDKIDFSDKLTKDDLLKYLSPDKYGKE